MKHKNKINMNQSDTINENFQKKVLDMFTKYFGKTYSELIKELGLPYEDKFPKSVGSIIIKEIIKRENSKIDQLDLSKFNIKTIRVDGNGRPQQSMSLAQLKYNKIVNETWKNSDLYRILSKGFIFIVFKIKHKDDKNPELFKVKFWQMSNEDFEIASNFWELTKDSIMRGDYNSFVSIKNDFIMHIRTKGVNNKDFMITPQKTLETKKGFWLNSSYIQIQIE